MHCICVRHTDSTGVSKFQVNTATNIEVIRQNAFSHARVMVICVNNSLKIFVFFLILSGRLRQVLVNVYLRSDANTVFRPGNSVNICMF